jgi:hypothetical protein
MFGTKRQAPPRPYGVYSDPRTAGIPPSHPTPPANRTRPPPMPPEAGFDLSGRRRKLVQRATSTPARGVQGQGRAIAVETTPPAAAAPPAHPRRSPHSRSGRTSPPTASRHRDRGRGPHTRCAQPRGRRPSPRTARRCRPCTEPIVPPTSATEIRTSMARVSVAMRLPATTPV